MLTADVLADAFLKNRHHFEIQKSDSRSYASVVGKANRRRIFKICHQRLIGMPTDVPKNDLVMLKTRLP